MTVVGPLAVVLGASGRLGRRATVRLQQAGYQTLCVARRAPALAGCPGARAMTVELSRPTDRSRLVAEVVTLAQERPQVVIVDTVLDRSGVNPMRASLRAAFDTVVLMGDGLTAVGVSYVVAVASTTAVLAPCPYQTPYGLAKRRQLLAYARSGVPGRALLLPMLAEQDAPVQVSAGGWPVWSFNHAAQQLLAGAATPLPPVFVVEVPSFADGADLARSRTARPDAAGVLLSHVRALVTNRNSMEPHRAAARARLLMTPRRVRRRVDHHWPTITLLHRFAARYHVQVRQSCSATTDCRFSQASTPEREFHERPC